MLSHCALILLGNVEKPTHSVDLKFLIIDADGDTVGPVTDGLLVVMEIAGELKL